MFKVPDQYRIHNGPGGSDDSYGNNGAFYVPFVREADKRETIIFCIASDGAGWEHVSASVKSPRCPTWLEMCHIKNVFWNHTDAVIQIHPPSDQYVDYHPFTLHLWRKCGTNDFFEAPPTILIGPK